MVTPRMEAAAWQSLAEGGAAALLTQAFGGVPYKVYAALAPSAGVPLSEFLLASALGRGARLLPVAAVAAFARRRLGKLIEERFAWAASAIFLGFFALLGVVVMVWS